MDFYNSAKNFDFKNIVIPDYTNPKHPDRGPVSRKPTPEDRKANRYTQFRKQLHRLTLVNGQPAYVMEGIDDYAELYRATLPAIPDPKQLFKQEIFDSLYNNFKAVANMDER